MACPCGRRVSAGSPLHRRWRPLVRYRELNRLLPLVATWDPHAMCDQRGSSDPAGMDGGAAPPDRRVIDGPAAEHDVRRAPATYDRIGQAHRTATSSPCTAPSPASRSSATDISREFVNLWSANSTRPARVDQPLHPSARRIGSRDSDAGGSRPRHRGPAGALPPRYPKLLGARMGSWMLREPPSSPTTVSSRGDSLSVRRLEKDHHGPASFGGQPGLHAVRVLASGGPGGRRPTPVAWRHASRQGLPAFGSGSGTRPRRCANGWRRQRLW